MLEQQARWHEVHKLSQLAELREQLREVDADIADLSARLRDGQVSLNQFEQEMKVCIA